MTNKIQQIIETGYAENVADTIAQLNNMHSLIDELTDSLTPLQFREFKIEEAVAENTLPQITEDGDVVYHDTNYFDDLRKLKDAPTDAKLQKLQHDVQEAIALLERFI